MIWLFILILILLRMYSFKRLPECDRASFIRGERKKRPDSLSWKITGQYYQDHEKGAFQKVR